MECGRVITGPYGYLVSRVLHIKDIYKKYVGLDACMANLMRPAMYGAYHHITVAGKEDQPHDQLYDVTGSLCENRDKFAVDRRLPKIDVGDLVVIHDAVLTVMPWDSITTVNCDRPNYCCARTAKFCRYAEQRRLTTISRHSTGTHWGGFRWGDSCTVAPGSGSSTATPTRFPTNAGFANPWSCSMSATTDKEHRLPRSPELMSRDDTALLVVNVQEKLVPAIADAARVVWNIRRLIDGAKILGNQQ